MFNIQLSMFIESRGDKYFDTEALVFETYEEALSAMAKLTEKVKKAYDSRIREVRQEEGLLIVTLNDNKKLFIEVVDV